MNHLVRHPGNTALRADLYHSNMQDLAMRIEDGGTMEEPQPDTETQAQAGE